MATSRYAPKLAAVLVLALLLAISVASPAVAQDEERVAAVDLQILRSTDGATVVPIRVTVVSQRAIDAVLEIRLEQSNLRWELPIALAANSEVEQLIAIPTSPGADWPIAVTLFADGEELDEDTTNARGANANAVGVLGIAAPGDEAQLSPDTGIASLIELNDLRIISALDTVVASPAGLQALTSEEQTELLTWVSSGRQLLIADEIGSVDGLLPAEWQGPGSIAPAGSGLIRYVGAVDWDEQIPPGVVSAASAQLLTGGFDSSSQELLSDGGFRVPSLGVLALILVVYLLLAGPISFAVLTVKGKQTLAWVVIPALAVLFTGGVFVAGRLLNSGRSDAYASIVNVSPVGSTVSDTILISRSGSQSIVLPDGWALSSTGVSRRFGNNDAATPITVRPSRTSTELQFDIESGSGGLAVLRGTTAQLQDALALSDLRVIDGELTGSVANTSSEDLENVTIMVGGRAVVLGVVANGASTSFALDISGNPAARFSPELQNWGVDPRQFNNFGFNGEPSEEMTDGPANGTSWLAWRGANFGAAVPEGLITAVGWSRDLDVSVLDGRGRTAVVRHGSLPSSDGPLVPGQVRSLRLSLPGGNPFDGFEGGFGGGQNSSMVTQFLRPAGGDSSALAIDLRRNISELSLWIDDEWRPFGLDNGSGPSVQIPEAAWQGDSLTVRYGVSEFFGDPGQLTTRLTVVGANTEELVLLEAGSDGRRQAQFDEPQFNEPELFEGLSTVVEIPDDLDGGFSFAATGELAGSFDTWIVDLNEGDSLTVWMDATDGNVFGGSQLDPSLRLRGPDGAELAFNDDFDGLNSKLDYVAAADGSYSIETAPLSGINGGGNYEVRIDVTSAGGGS